jgi:ribonuclease T1
MKQWRLLFALVALAAFAFVQIEGLPGDRSTPPGAPHDTRAPAPDIRAASPLPAFLPAEAHDTLALIARGGPFPHRQDGAVFQNRERLLPAQPRGWYREYTVRTPGERTRGARRIVTGGEPPREFWYTADHYASFRRFEVPR